MRALQKPACPYHQRGETVSEQKRPWTHEEFLAHERKLVEAQKQERDNHFAGFAKLLWDDLLEANGHGYIDVNADDNPADGWSSLDGRVERPGYLTVIARRAYDLVVHALNTCSLEAFEIMGNGAQEVPDLTEWPRSEQEQ